jgi:hypothetical protein
MKEWEGKNFASILVFCRDGKKGFLALRKIKK